MTILRPLWIASLVSLLILLLIYILKPNFQQKFVSSTFIWKLSLKRKKKKLPISKLKNILLIICQVLILCALTLVLMNPVKILKSKVDNEEVLILDASCSMRTIYDDETRYERAIDKIIEEANKCFNEGGTVSVIIATDKPYFLAEQAKPSQRYQIEMDLLNLKLNDTCTYGEISIDSAISLCSDIMLDNPDVIVNIYTDLTVNYVPDGINIVNVQKAAENNVAILDAFAEVSEGYYSFIVDVASYGRNETVTVSIRINGANAIPESLPLGMDYDYEIDVDLDNDQTKRVIFTSEINPDADESTVYSEIPTTDRIFSYTDVMISIDADDCFEEDNTFSIYGGTKEPLEILYASDSINPFISGVLLVMQSKLAARFDVNITECKGQDEIPYSGYDLYIYEHKMMPQQAPVDGVVIYADPDPEKSVSNSGFRVNKVYDFSRVSLSLTEENTHEITNGVIADNITVSRIDSLSSGTDAGYQVLMTCDGAPVLLLKDDENIKSIVMLFSLHYSNFALLKDFPLFFYNIFNYFMPATISGNSFEVNDTVEVKSRSREIVVSGYNEVVATIDEFPGNLTLSLPGTYTIYQETYFGKEISEEVFVKIPKAECNIFATLDSISSNVLGVNNDSFIQDLLFYVALGLVGLVFFEWILKGNDAI